MKDINEDNFENNIRQRRKPTWKEKRTYFLKLLENVLLTGVPQIVTEQNLRRKIFRTSVFFICLSGFLYHLISFIILYLSYPTTLEVLVKFQEESTLPKPIVTICDMNGIRRTAYCEDFPDDCVEEVDAETLCSLYGYFCKNENGTKDIVFPNWFNYFFSDFNRSLVTKYGSRAEDILYLYKNATKPVIFANEFGKLRNCYSIDLMHFNSSSIDDFTHQYFRMHMLDVAAVGDVIMKFNPEDSFYPTQTVGAKVSIHSHEQFINPFIDGFEVSPNSRYIIQLKAIEENLLASPYTTNCTTYDGENSYGTEDPFNRERCLVECRKERWLKECGCISGQYIFHIEENLCSYEKEINCIEHINTHDCFHECKVNCRSIFFDYEVDEVSLDNTDVFHYYSKYVKNESDLTSTFLDPDWYIKKTVLYSSLNFFFKRPELLIYKYKPEFQLIELFSYIGGYIGIWLGISLIAVCDFLETLFTFCYHLCKGKIPVKAKDTSNSLLQIKCEP